MVRNYLKIAWRNIIHNKVSSCINISGLAIGMAVSFMLLLYVYNEYSFDRFHTNNDRLYQVFKNQPSNGEIKTKDITPRPLSAVLQKDFPEVEDAARMSEVMSALVAHENKALKLQTVAADPSLMRLFSFDFVAGNQAAALTDEKSIILTQSVAKAIFGSKNPIGEVIRYNDQFPLKVSAVIKDHPVNSSFKFQAVIPWEGFMDQQPWLKDTGWDNYAYATYVLLKKGPSVASANARIKNLIGKNFAPDKDIKLFMYPFNRLHLYGEFKNGVNVGGSITYVRLFLLLAMGILLIACINFMNLATARSERRAREVGVRKAIGARRFALIKQFMTESVLMALLAFLISILLMMLLTPVFNNTMHIQLSVPYLNPVAWCMALAVTVLTGVLAGSYPALYLSSFNAVKAIKGQLTASTFAFKPRQALVVFQFSFSICLILGSIAVYRQIAFIANKPVGYNKRGLIEMPVDGAMYNNFESFRQEAIAAAAISDGASISEPITKITSANWKNYWPGQLPGEDKVPIDCIGVTHHFVSTYQLKIVEGRDFDTGRPSDSTAVILNKAAVKLMRFKDPIGKVIKWMGAERTVIGVVDNFVWGSPYEPVKPTIIGFVAGWSGNIGLRLNPQLSASKSIALLNQLYKKYNPAYPFEYTFTDENFDKKFQSEQVLGSMAITFTCLAVIISCLGLFGLASFSAERRRKEISIRKVLGVSVTGIWFKLSKEFVILILVSFVIGSAISLYYINNWLSGYTYHTSITFGAFMFTLIASLTICLLAVSWQAIKAGYANPVNNLRSE